MRGYPTFAEALAHALDAAPDTDHQQGGRFVDLPESTAQFIAMHLMVVASGARAQAAYYDALPQPRGPLFPMRGLTAHQQRAVDEMAALGVRLGPNFTETELRRAFRRLARQYHPDRHPDSGAVAQARLARIFGDVSQHYRCLMALFE
jgi:hypothetical protein